MKNIAYFLTSFILASVAWKAYDRGDLERIFEQGKDLFEKEQVAAEPASPSYADTKPVQEKKGYIIEGDYAIEGEYDNWLPGYVYGSRTTITITQPTPKTLQWIDREGKEHKAYMLDIEWPTEDGVLQRFYKERSTGMNISWKHDFKTDKTLVMKYHDKKHEWKVWVGRNLKGDTHDQLFEDFVGPEHVEEWRRMRKQLGRLRQK